MVLAFSDDLQTGLSLRVSRYPDQGVAWVWCHVISRGRLLAYSDSRLPCDDRRNAAEAETADYGVSQIGLEMVREGPSTALRSVRFAARLGVHASDQAPEGAGDIPLALSGEFIPDWQSAGALPGRYEQTGRVALHMNVDGTETRFTGVAKAHEQTQTTPRFGPKFTYAMLWGESGSLIGLSANGRGRGEYTDGEGQKAVDALDIEPWRPDRRIRASLAGGGEVSGVAHSAQAFRVPVFGRQWHGSMVSAEIGGQKLVGMINDWPGLD